MTNMQVREEQVLFDSDNGEGFVSTTLVWVESNGRQYVFRRPEGDLEEILAYIEQDSTPSF